MAVYVPSICVFLIQHVMTIFSSLLCENICRFWFIAYYFCLSIFLGKTAFYSTDCIVLALFSASFLHRIVFDSLHHCLCVCVVVVMNDIITTMFNKKFLEELFKPQELYSKKALRTVFDRLAHASIMRLNQASMDKVKTQLKSRMHCHFLEFWE